MYELEGILWGTIPKECMSETDCIGDDVMLQELVTVEGDDMGITGDIL